MHKSKLDTTSSHSDAAVAMVYDHLPWQVQLCYKGTEQPTQNKDWFTNTSIWFYLLEVEASSIGSVTKACSPSQLGGFRNSWKAAREMILNPIPFSKLKKI